MTGAAETEADGAAPVRVRIALLVSEFNGGVTSRMEAVARECAQRRDDAEVVRVARVPGVYDMPVVADALLRSPGVDAVVVLGAVVRGQTKHDEVIAHAAARTLSEMSVRHGKPVALGVTGPGMHERQAHARIRPVAERAVAAAVRVFQELGRIGG